MFYQVTAPPPNSTVHRSLGNKAPSVGGDRKARVEGEGIE